MGYLAGKVHEHDTPELDEREGYNTCGEGDVWKCSCGVNFTVYAIGHPKKHVWVEYTGLVDPA